jgi:simple sugar transport system substrate-binding protein
MKKGLITIIVLLLGCSFLLAEISQAEEPKYTFYDVFWDVTDPNMAWFTAGAADFMKRYPEVKVNVVAAEKWDPEVYLQTLETVLAKNPDGLVVCVVDPVTIEDAIKKANDKGIPVIAATLPDYRPNAPKYLTYMGGDELLTGKVLGERLLKEITPKHVVVTLPHLGHAGAELRAKGMEEVVTKVGAKVDKLAIGNEPEVAKSTLTAYLTKNPDVDAIFTTAMLANEWIYSVMKEMGKTNIKLLSVDDSPSSLEGIITGRILASHSQGFYAQGTMPYEWLFYYLEYGIEPPPIILTGPIVIDQSNAVKFKNTAIKVFGEQRYKEISPW